MKLSLTVEELSERVGQELGYSEWLEITQERVQAFADATNDQQWIHTDPEKAKAESPFGGTIAHGYLVLSLAPFFQEQIFEVQNVRQVINCGLGKVRFGTPVPVGSKVRMGIVLDLCRKFGDALQLHMSLSIEVDGEKKAACRAESITRLYL